MNIPHEVEQLILEFVGVKRKHRCIAETKHKKLCSRRPWNKQLLCLQHMKLVNSSNEISISPTFIKLCLLIHQAARNASNYQRRKVLLKRRGKTYNTSTGRYNYWNINPLENMIISAYV